MKTQPTVLVTGTTGFVGPHLIRELQANNYRVIGVGRLDGPTTERIEDVFIETDLTDLDSVKELPWNEIEAVIHLAGLSSPAESFKHPQRFMSMNTAMVTNLFESAIDANVAPNFLVVSTGAVYKPSATPLSEESDTFVSSPYVASKLATELIVKHYRTRGFNATIVRPMNHTGPGQLPGFITPDIASQIVSKQQPIKVGNLLTKRDYTDVRDVVQAYVAILKLPDSNETYNICSGVARSGQEILDALVAAAGLDSVEVEAAVTKLRPTDIPEISGSNAKLNAATGWSPSISFEQTMQDVIDFWKTQDLN